MRCVKGSPRWKTTPILKTDDLWLVVPTTFVVVVVNHCGEGPPQGGPFVDPKIIISLTTGRPIPGTL